MLRSFGSPGFFGAVRYTLARTAGAVLLAIGSVSGVAPVAAAPMDGPAEQAYAPVTIENCGVTTTYRQAPRRAVSLTQHTTEVMLALGLEDRMVGTAYLDDKILPQYEASYKKVPVLAAQYPSKEILINAQPDFVYAGFASAFRADRISTREELKQFGADTYLTSAICKDGKMSMEDVYTDILNIGKIFGIEPHARAYVETIKQDLEEVTQSLSTAIASRGSAARVALYDSQTEAPFVAACCGAAAMAIEASGATNLFTDLPGGWSTASWETFVERDPEVVILIEAEWSSAREKAQFLLTNPALSTVKAIRDVRFVVVPFSSTSPGIRNSTLIRQLAVALYPEIFR